MVCIYHKHLGVLVEDGTVHDRLVSSYLISCMPSTTKYDNHAQNLQSVNPYLTTHVNILVITPYHS